MKKLAFVTVRISAPEKAELVKAAAREGLKLSAWLLQVALREATTTREPAP